MYVNDETCRGRPLLKFAKTVKGAKYVKLKK